MLLSQRRLGLALIEKGVPFQFTQKVHSRNLENNIKLIAISVLFHRKHFLLSLKKQAPKMPEFNTNQNFASPLQGR